MLNQCLVNKTRFMKIGTFINSLLLIEIKKNDLDKYAKPIIIL